MASGEIRLSTTTMRQMPVLAQSQTSTQAQTSSDGLQEVVVTASITYGPQQSGNFACGGVTCSWQMGSYVDSQFSSSIRGATLLVKGPGIPNGSKWVQTYIATGQDDTGQPVQDCSSACPFYTGPYTNSQNFYDQPGRYDSSANWFAMTTLVGPNGSPIAAFTWGFLLSSGGISLILPQVVTH
jgi:hypothetical protein